MPTPLGRPVRGTPSSPRLSDALSLPLQLTWLIPVYGFSGMLLSLPWATGWIKRNGPRPAAYLNLLVTLLAVIHGSLVIREVAQIGPQHLDFPWFQAEIGRAHV